MISFSKNSVPPIMVFGLYKYLYKDELHTFWLKYAIHDYWFQRQKKKGSNATLLF